MSGAAKKVRPNEGRTEKVYLSLLPHNLNPSGYEKREKALFSQKVFSLIGFLFDCVAIQLYHIKYFNATEKTGKYRTAKMPSGICPFLCRSGIAALPAYFPLNTGK